MKRFAAIALLLLFTSNASAALLAEFSLADSNSGGRTGYIEISRWAGSPLVHIAVWEDTTRATSTGHSLRRRETSLEVFNTRLDNRQRADDTLIRSDVFDDVHKWQSPLTNKFGLGLEPGCCGLAHSTTTVGGVQPIVPQLGPAAFEGYKITGLVRQLRRLVRQFAFHGSLSCRSRRRGC